MFQSMVYDSVFPLHPRLQDRCCPLPQHLLSSFRSVTHYNGTSTSHSQALIPGCTIAFVSSNIIYQRSAAAQTLPTPSASPFQVPTLPYSHDVATPAGSCSAKHRISESLIKSTQPVHKSQSITLRDPSLTPACLPQWPTSMQNCLRLREMTPEARREAYLLLLANSPPHHESLKNQTWLEKVSRNR